MAWDLLNSLVNQTVEGKPMKQNTVMTTQSKAFNAGMLPMKSRSAKVRKTRRPITQPLDPLELEPVESWSLNDFSDLLPRDQF